MKVDPSEFELEFFEEIGFERKRCPECGEYFWGPPEAEVCNETPCVEYSFIGDPPASVKLDVWEAGEEFLRFFERHDHEVLDRYPVAARWRDDIHLTIASIACFQPWVTSGEVPPPANPLVINQPCIRLNDIDNVGRTGRHFTLFHMGGHHAFNNHPHDRKDVYWKEETVRLCYEFTVEKLGIPDEKIAFKESWWEGGGNAGPCFEVVVDGLELATLVFMQYEQVGGKYRELPQKIVDTGYGIERYAWITTGEPTAYDAVFGDLVNATAHDLGVEIDGEAREILGELARVAGLMDVETESDLRVLRERVARRLDLDVSELVRVAEPVEFLYGILDHARCLTFMLGDGVVPSNAGEGYLARLVIRRVLRLLDGLNAEREYLLEVVERVLEDLRGTYPELAEREEYIRDALECEIDRYIRALKRGRREVRKRLEEKGKLSFEDLVELYDSHGIPPEVAREIVEEEGVEIEVPDDFYSRIAERHEGPEEVEEGLEELERIAVEEELPETELAFYDDEKRFEFKAEVIGTFEVNGDTWVVLDRTYFYPEGGGQETDFGTMRWKDGEAEVREVQKVRGVVFHRIDGDVPPEGAEVECEVDSERRMRLTRNHTATHVILEAARRVLGDHVWQAGAHKSTDEARLDITHHRRISDEELREIERLANEIVMKNLPVNKRFMDRNEAERRYGFELYQGGVVPGREIRVVEIEGWNVQACAGTHCDNTGEIGPIKIVGRERIQDGVERIKFAAGEAALERIWETEDLLRETCEVLRVNPENLPKTVKRFFEEWKEQRKRIGRLERELVEAKLRAAPAEGRRVGDLKVTLVKLEGVEVGSVAGTVEDLVEEHEDLVLVAKIVSNGSCQVVVGSGESAPPAGEIIREIGKLVEGGGGGDERLAQGGGRNPDGLTEDRLVEIVEDLAGGMKNTPGTEDGR
ncbi:alanine--tRNA ligase [Methanopyrus sp.]